ncbi:Catenin alpha-2 [Microtus ochrogaster]|uniref:Catenin alpha-2 n=1 Tax=Microtus ochrogaster TaxID=79684 RepID=A0A8J6L6C5_MICOH|nr:Catenin alpha-2 [Microtus ochrogaster]
MTCINSLLSTKDYGFGVANSFKLACYLDFFKIIDYGFYFFSIFIKVTTLVNTSNKGPSGKKKGRSKKAHVLAASVEQATQNFLEKGEQIAKESQDLKEELVAAVEDVRKQGETMRIASSEFADDPCSSVKRGTMVRAARALLSAVTRLLILADMADVMRLLSHLKIVEEALEAVKNATNEQDLANRFKEFGKEMVKLNYVAARRQQVGKIGNVSGGWELKDPHCRDEMAAARGALKKNATMLYTASQAFLRHPDVAATRANRDYVFKQVQEAIAGISSAAQATSPTDEAKGHTGIGELAAALNEFDNKIILDPMTFSEARFRPSLEERLESIISGAALMADSSCTRDDRRERIVAECNAVRQALQDLLSEYMNNEVLPLLQTIAAEIAAHSLAFQPHGGGTAGAIFIATTLWRFKVPASKRADNTQVLSL